MHFLYMPRRLFILFPFVCMLMACQPAREAQHVVAQADSLRVNHGVTYGAVTGDRVRDVADSLALAEAYTLLGHWRLIYPDDYARACYYYGRMLRHRGDQVAAMRAFIAGTHAPYVSRVVPLPWFSNYHILGRIYSNMGTMCHLADEFELSYDMYERSANSFRTVGDMTSNYYALNEMALELAEQDMHDETLALLDSIEHNCTNDGVLTKLWETKAILYFNLEQYDSTIYSVKRLQEKGNYGSTGYVKEAQAFWSLQQYDSALYYAKMVQYLPDASAKDKFNMLHILIYNDSTVDTEETIKRTEERSDIDKEILDPLHVQLAQAIDVLLQDRDRKPYHINIGLFILSLCIVGGIAWIAVVRIRRHRKHMYAVTEQERQKQQDLRKQQKELEKQNANILADMSRLQANNDALRQENADLSVLHSERRAELMAQIVNNCDAIRNSEKWKDVFYWNKHDKLCEVADKHLNLLSTKLQMLEVLNEREIHLCILVTIGNFSDKQLAQLLNYSEKSIRSIKLNAAKKLGTTSAHLHDFLMQKATE